MPKKKEKIQQLLDLARRTGVLHTRDLKPLGLPSVYLGRLCAKGLLAKTSRGIYIVPGGKETIHLGLMHAAKAIPKGVVCLLSALRFHEIGTQAPHEVWIAISNRAAQPHVDYPKVRIVRFSGKALTEGVEEHVIDGVRVKVYNPAKTVADCFKYRNKIGLDVALEALRDVHRKRTCSNDAIWNYAKICRVAEVIRPYMEATS